jgi:hypothetical protein
MFPLLSAGTIVGAFLAAVVLPTQSSLAAEMAIKVNPHRDASRWTAGMYRDAEPMPWPASDFIEPALRPQQWIRPEASPTRPPKMELVEGLGIRLYEPVESEEGLLPADMARGTPRVGWMFTLTAAACNLIRLPKLLAGA